MRDYRSLAHTRWDCKYHIVFIPKRRQKVIFGSLRKFLGEIFHELAQRKGCKIVEGHLMRDHVHICISVPPKYSVSSVVGYLKGKCAIESLLTADKARRRAHKMKITGPSHDERLMQKESFAALQAVAEEPREPVTLKIGGKEFRCNVHYQILTFSIGVNDLAVKTTGKLLGARSGSSSRNEEAMSLLFGDGQKAGMFDRQLAKLPDSEKEQALKLARCVQSFYDSDIQSKSPSEAFRLAETLVALAYKVNIVPYWFCKSGTDRTLELAISIRRLCCDQAYGLSPESLLQYPHPYSKECTKTMSVLCGVPELQGSNRGTSGFKSLTLQNQLGPILSHESEYKPAMIP